MPRNPRTLRSPRTPEREMSRRYNRMLRPMLDEMYGPFTQAASLQEAAQEASITLARIEAHMEANEGAVLDPALQSLSKVDRMNLRNTVSSFRSALGIDIGDFLRSDTATGDFVFGKARQTADLIKTIPRRALADVVRDIGKLTADAPFDREAIANIIRAKKAGLERWQVTRIARTQAAATHGYLVQRRQTSLGVNDFKWRDSDDDRVRPRHQEYDGNTYAWSEPPDGVIPGQEPNCRCTASPVIDAAAIARIRSLA